MVKGIYLASQNLNSTMKKMSNIANNLANINTTGFKRIRPFSEILQESGNIKTQQLIDWNQGDLLETSNPLDVGLNGKGFLTVQTDNGIRYTRAGHLKINKDGNLIDSKGHNVMGINGPVLFNGLEFGSETDVKISGEGEISVGGKYLDTLLITSGDQINDFELDGNDYFKSINGSVKPANPEDYLVQQGYLESSNVNAVNEMQSMINVSSNYESAQRMVTFLDETMKKAQEVGRV